MAISGAVFILPLVMWPSLTDYNYAKCITSLIFISLLLVLWGLDAWRRPSWTIRIPWVLIPSGGLVLAGTLSLIHATHAYVTIQSLVLLAFFILLLWMVANMVREPRDVCWILGAFLSSALLAGLYGVLQYYGVVSGAPGATGVSAIISSFGNRNHLGGLLLYLFYPSIILLVRSKQIWAKMTIVIGISSMFWIMLLVEQAATRIAFALVTVALLIGSFLFRPKKPLRSNQWWLIALAVAVLSISAVTAIQSPPTESPGDLWENNSGSARMWFWLVGVEMLADYPSVGVGLGNYKIDFYPYKAEFAATERGQDFDFAIHRVSQAHNDYLQAAAELGVVGFVILISALAVLAATLWIRLRHTRDYERLDLLLLTGGILAYLAHAVVSFPAHVATSSLLMVVFCGIALSPRFGDSLTLRWRLTGRRARLLHMGVIAVALVVSSFAISDLRANWLMERGFDKLQAGLYASAEAQLQQSLKLDFAPRQTYYYIAIAQIQLGKLELAEANMELCRTKFVDERFYLTYADLKKKLAKWDEAQEAIEILLATHPSQEVDQRARYIEATLCIEQRDFGQAVQLLTSLTLDYPMFEPGLVALGQIYAAQGLTFSARTSFETALKLIDDKIAVATSKLPSATLAESRLIRDEIETLTAQRDHIVGQLSNLK